MIVTYRGTVYPSQCDHMGHMNVMWYVAKFDEASWQLLAMLGLTASRFRSEGIGMAAVDQHLEYRRELHAGDAVTIRSAIVGVAAKSIRVVTVVTPSSSMNVTRTIASPEGYPSPTVPGSYASVCTSLAAGSTSRKMPAKPNSLPSWSLRQRHR